MKSFTSFEHADPHRLTSFGEGFHDLGGSSTCCSSRPTLITLMIDHAVRRHRVQEHVPALNVSMLFLFALCESVTVAFIVVVY